LTFGFYDEINGTVVKINHIITLLICMLVINAMPIYMTIYAKNNRNHRVMNNNKQKNNHNKWKNNSGYSNYYAPSSYASLVKAPIFFANSKINTIHTESS
jgi:hypothetical protein